MIIHVKCLQYSSQADSQLTRNQYHNNKRNCKNKVFTQEGYRTFFDMPVAGSLFRFVYNHKHIISIWNMNTVCEKFIS